MDPLRGVLRAEPGVARRSRSTFSVTDRLPSGFHDAALLDLHVDLPGRAVALTFDFCVGDPGAPGEAEREARLGGPVTVVAPKALLGRQGGDGE